MKTFEQAFETLPTNGWLTEDEARLLWDVASATTGIILEIGTYYGRSLCLLASLERIVVAVDPLDNFDSDKSGDEIESYLLANLETRNLRDYVLFHRKRIEDWYVGTKPALIFGFAYLDGDHTYEGTLAQIDAAIRCGITDMCLHDFINDGGGIAIVKAVHHRNLELIQHVGRMAHCRSTQHGS